MLVANCIEEYFMIATLTIPLIMPLMFMTALTQIIVMWTVAFSFLFFEGQFSIFPFIEISLMTFKEVKNK